MVDILRMQHCLFLETEDLFGHYLDIYMLIKKHQETACSYFCM